MNMHTTPIALFVYNRPDYTESAIRSITACNRFEECTLCIFCDGPRSPSQAASVAAARQVARRWSAQVHATVIERPQNLGPDRSIVQGVTDLLDQYGQVIVIEDDQQFSPDFLDYMLQGLARYREEPCVYQIAGFMSQVEHPSVPDAFFLPYTKPWGWATWARAWSAFDWGMPGFSDMYGDWPVRWRFDLDGHCRYAAGTQQGLRKGVNFGLEHRSLAWDFVWYWCVFRRNGLALFPRRSLVWVGGFDGSGVHSPAVPLRQDALEAFLMYRLSSPIRLPEHVSVDTTAYRRSKEQLGKDEFGTSSYTLIRYTQWFGEYGYRWLQARYPALSQLIRRAKYALHGPPH